MNSSDTGLIISFIIYTAGIVAIGLYSSLRRKETADDFVLANRELGPWTSALSASASAESGWVMLGMVGMAFSSGLSTLWIVPGIAVGYLFNWFVLAEKLRAATAETGANTLTQFIMHRFGRDSAVLRYLPVLIISLAMLGYVAAQMNAAGKAFEAVFHLPYWIGVLVGASIVLGYTVTGGFRAICWTDVIQAGFMMVALLFMPFVMLNAVGGIDAVWTTISVDSPDLLTLSGGNTGIAFLGFVIGMLGIGLGYPGQPHILSRFMAAKDKATVNKAGVIAFTWFVFVYTGAIFFGLFARAYYGTLADVEQALPLACGDLLPPILGGFVIAAIVSAICSTADSQLIVVSTTLSRDVFGRGKGSKDSEARDGRRYQKTDRLMLIALGLISVLFALTENRVIFTFVLYAWGVLGAAFGPLMILALLWKRTNKAGAIAGMVVGTVTAVVWKEVAALSSIVYELVPAFILAFLAIIVVTLVTSERKEKL